MGCTVSELIYFWFVVERSNIGLIFARKILTYIVPTLRNSFKVQPVYHCTSYVLYRGRKDDSIAQQRRV